MIRKGIPNFITCLNLFSGCIGITVAFSGNLVIAAAFIAIAAIFDFLDGLIARILHVKSEIGKELDSLADVISFGLLPSVILYYLMKQSFNLPGAAGNLLNPYPYLAFLVAVFSALRLAKFNLDPRQVDSFIGLPTPASAIFFGSFPLIMNQLRNTGGMEYIGRWIGNYYFLSSITIIFTGLLVSEIPLFSLKVKNLKWHDNKYRFFLLLFSLVAIIFLGFIALPLIIIFYILLSLILAKS